MIRVQVTVHLIILSGLDIGIKKRRLFLRIG